MLMGCSPHRATTVEPGSYVRPYTVYARQVSGELRVLLWESNQACLFIGQEAGMCHWLACLPLMALLWSDAWAVRRVASSCLACKWTVPNLAWWSVPNFAWWSVPNLHACMSYLYVCMCGCTADTCLLVFLHAGGVCMLPVRLACLRGKW
jgi:hypothetical protein